MAGKSTTDDRKKAAAYLEALQRSAYEGLEADDRARLHSWRHIDGARRERFIREFYDLVTPGEPFEAFRAECIELIKGASSHGGPYGGGFSRTVDTISSQIENILRMLPLPAPQPMMFGALPTGRVNGMAVRVPDSAYVLILIHDGLFAFAGILADIVARAFPCTPWEDRKLRFSVGPKICVRELRADPQIGQQFLELLVAYLIWGNPRLAPRHLPEQRYLGLSSALRQSMETFVLGHEYGHVIAGHMGGGPTRRRALASTHVDEIATNWFQELEADVRGLELVVNVMMGQNYDLALGYWGTDLFFRVIDVVEQGVSILRTGSPEVGVSHTHPPPALRNENILEVLKRSVSPEEAEMPIILCRSLEAIVEALWADAEPHLREMHLAGVGLAPIWAA